jgi:hypothetical protein
MANIDDVSVGGPMYFFSPFYYSGKVLQGKITPLGDRHVSESRYEYILILDASKHALEIYVYAANCVWNGSCDRA